ncbi:type IV secretion system DNA-binding domain-containing protein [Patescibacteria group bacterium]|nr:type IV secretion system DNA-binding domain-containing protein [Patescibacteria group bacterium]
MPVEYNHDHENEITLFAETNFRNANRRFGIKTDDRRRHIYIIGKTGMGKTTLMENMVLSDIVAGHGVCYVDPHGDTAEKMLDFIPANRINDVVYFNPADQEYPMGFNILETVAENEKHLVASGLMGVFKKIWPDVWSPRMEYILLNCVLALLDYPGATLLGINRLLVDKDYRSRVIDKIRDPIVKTFWVAEFSSWSEKYATEAIAPVQNKVGQFLSASIIRNIVAQVKSTIDPRRIMDEGKILIVNLSKGRIGEDNMRLLGGMLITKIQMAAMERVSIPEPERRDFYLYVDEFQNFANQSFANILSEARKYRLSLVVAHQYIKQLEEEVAWAVFGNVGTIITFRVGAEDAAFMENEFMPTYIPEDLLNLGKTQIYLKLMVDGAATTPFSANTLAPIGKRTGNGDKVVAVSRERYGSPRAEIEDKVLKWSGMERGTGSGLKYPEILTEDEQKEKADRDASKPEDTLAELEGETGHNAVEYLKISPERLAAIAKPPAEGKKKEKPQFPHTCSRCGKVWNMPIQLDVSRPMYCAECLPIIKEERTMKPGAMKAAFRAPASEPASVVLESAQSTSARGNALTKAFAPLDDAPKHHPRVEPPAKGTIKIVPADQVEEDESFNFFGEIQKTKGKPVELNKEKLTTDHQKGGRPSDGKRHDAPKQSKRPGPTHAPSAPQPPAAPQPTATVFKKTASSVLRPGERISFEDEA